MKATRKAARQNTTTRCAACGKTRKLSKHLDEYGAEVDVCRRCAHELDLKRTLVMGRSGRC